MIAAGQTVLDEGAARVFAACTHPVFSGPAYERLAESPFEQVVVTDTIPLREGAPDKIVVLSCASCWPTRSARSSPTVGQRRVRRREPAVLAALGPRA